MNFQRVHYFLVFCKSMHFTNAAKELQISQPALAKAIGLLEEELGTRLVRREGKHTHLTSRGRSALKIFSTMMSHVYKVDTEIERAFNDNYEQLRLAVVASLDFTLLAEFLRKYHLANPKVHINIVDCKSQDCVEVLLHGQADCLITIDSKSLSNKAECIKLYEEKLVIAGASSEVESSNNRYMLDSVSDDLAEHESVKQNIFSVTNTQVEPVVQCSQQLWTQQLVKKGLGFGVVSQSGDVIEGLGIFENQDALKTQTISAVIPVGRTDCRAIKVFVRMLREHDWK